MKMKRPYEARAHFREAIRLDDDLAARQPPVGFSRAILAQSWLHMGQIEAARGRDSDAGRAFRRAAGEYAQTQAQGALRTDDPFHSEAIKAAAAGER